MFNSPNQGRKEKNLLGALSFAVDTGNWNWEVLFVVCFVCIDDGQRGLRRYIQ
jgi:hypothetical protein